MQEAKLVAVLKEKARPGISTTCEVVEMRYRIKDNVLWISDHRGHVMDFDLDEFYIEIKSVTE